MLSATTVCDFEGRKNRMLIPKIDAESDERLARSRRAAQRGDYAEAYELIRDLPLTCDLLPEGVLLKASLAVLSKQYDDALQLYDDLLGVFDTCSTIHLNRIECLLQLGRLAEAEAAMESEVSPLQGHYGRHLMLARLAAQRRQPALVKAHLIEAYRLHPRALTCAARFPELQPHLWQMTLNAWPAWQFDQAQMSLN
jgi:tetratricopeptide (TPR) repeat protein